MPVGAYSVSPFRSAARGLPSAAIPQGLSPAALSLKRNLRVLLPVSAFDWKYNTIPPPRLSRFFQNFFVSAPPPPALPNIRPAESLPCPTSAPPNSRSAQLPLCPTPALPDIRSTQLLLCPTSALLNSCPARRPLCPTPALPNVLTPLFILFFPLRVPILP